VCLQEQFARRSNGVQTATAKYRSEMQPAISRRNRREELVQALAAMLHTWARYMVEGRMQKTLTKLLNIASELAQELPRGLVSCKQDAAVCAADCLAPCQQVQECCFAAAAGAHLIQGAWQARDA
jgi:hypothetical protein